MKDHIVHNPLMSELASFVDLARPMYSAIIIGAFYFPAAALLAAEPMDLAGRLEKLCQTREDPHFSAETAQAEAKTKAAFIAENADAIIAYVERRVDEVQRPGQHDREALRLLSAMRQFACSVDKEKGLALCLRLLRNMERTLLIVEEFLFNANVNYWEVLGEGGTKFVRLVQHTIRELLGTFQHYHSSLGVPEAKRYLLLEWRPMGLDVNALDYLMARGIDDLEVRAWLEALAKDPTSRLNTKDYLAVRWKGYKKW
jgi:alkylation response protein AidB-like acyl-CoA dehydrogenase